MRYRSLVGGAIGDIGFEAGDLIDVPDDKVDVWLAGGLIEPDPGVSPARRVRAVQVAAVDGASVETR